MGQINDWMKTKDGNLTLEIRHTQRTIGDAMKAANVYFQEQKISAKASFNVAQHFNPGRFPWLGMQILGLDLGYELRVLGVQDLGARPAVY